jgi:glycosyltransferase involved in cell wall biosynthesis
MSRVLLVSNYAWTIFNFRKNLIGRLQQLGYEVFIQTQFDGYEGRLDVPRARVYPLRINRKGTNPFEDALTLVSFYRTIGKIEPAVCLFFTIKPIIYGGIAASLRSTPFICNVTGLGTAFDSGWIRAIAARLYRSTLSRASHVFFQNDSDFTSFVAGGIVRRDHASLLPGSGVDLFRFRLTPYPSNPDPIFLLVARLLTSKGVGEYVEAARRIRATDPRVRFQLMGPTGVVNPSAISPAQVDQWSSEGVIEYLGAVDDVYPYVAKADCIVLPSYYREGTPRSLLEAAAVGRPIVTTDHPGCREVVEDGVTGFLCKPKDVEDLVYALQRVIDTSVSRRAEMGRYARQKMEREFDEHIVLDNYISMISRALPQTYQAPAG